MGDLETKFRDALWDTGAFVSLSDILRAQTKTGIVFTAPPPHRIRPGGTVHAMDCEPCKASKNAGIPHMDPRYETYWSM